MKTKILIVAAHPDDEILGCGGTIARYIKEGNEACTLILGEGITSRVDQGKKEKQVADIKKLKEYAHKANRIIGVKKIFIYDFPDNKFDTVALLDIIKVIEKIKKQIKPDIIFTHHRGDLNLDHRITFDAVLTACRPLKTETVKKIFVFETLSSTEWGISFPFLPTVFVDIKETIDEKMMALKAYKSEIRKYPHPRSKEGVTILAKYRGMEGGCYYAEAFQLVKDLVK